MRKVTKSLLTVGVAALAFGSCGDTVEVIAPEPPALPPAPPPLNQAPEARGRIPAHQVAVGGTSSQDVAGYFADRDGDELRYTATSSNGSVATVAMEGTTVTMTGVADGTAVVTVTAWDQEGASAAQGISVTVGDGDGSNNAPVATSTIPDHSVRMGGSVSVDASGYFRDPDGDELSYSATSANDAVATVAMEGSTATISGVAVGSAVVTITASDGEASLSQGFNVTVTEESTIRPATVTIFGLRSVTDRNESIDPTNVVGDVSVLLDVQYNDETVTAIDLTLGRQVISCRGTSSDAALPAGLAESGGQVEVECFFDTDVVKGECRGRQLASMYANGDHQLGARVRTAEGTTREALASQRITLNNANYIVIDHDPGQSVVERGVPFYGGPTTNNNVNTFDVCPVAFDGTVVGGIGLRALSDRGTENSVSFREHPEDEYGKYFGEYVWLARPPFTWTVHSDNNEGIEDRPQRDGHRIIQDRKIEDPDGLDITSKFVRGDPDRDLTEIGPIYFDFAAPRLTDANSQGGQTEIGINYETVEAGTYYSARRPDGHAQPVTADPVVEHGVGGVTREISVGDCSVEANTDTGERGAETAFVPLLAGVRTIGQLPEEDPHEDPSDDGGVQCYVAELQSLEDDLGNATDLSEVRVQTAAPFGVDLGAPIIDDKEPDEELVLKDESAPGVPTVLSFEVEDPELETGEDGSGMSSMILTWAGPEDDPYWGSAEQPSHAEMDEFGNVTIPTRVGPASKGGVEDGKHTVTVVVHDNASPPNEASTSFTFIRDTRPPTFSAGTLPSSVNAGSADEITVTISGTIKDMTPIETALMRAWINNGDTSSCGESADEVLPTGSGGRINRNGFDLENNTNEISFTESLTIKRGSEGAEDLCFTIDTEDSAVDENDDGPGNTARQSTGFFTVTWGGGGGSGNSMTVAVTDATLSEGTPADSAVFSVVLDAAPTGAEDVTITFGGLPGGVTANPTTAVFDGSSNPWDRPQSITVKAGQDDNAVNEEFSITAAASGGGYDGVRGSPVRLTVLDDDATLEVDDVSIDEGATDTVTVTAALASPAGSGGTDVTVDIFEGDGSNQRIAAISPSPTVAEEHRTISIPEGMRTGTLVLEIQTGVFSGTSDATLTVTASFGTADQNVYPVAGVDITLVNNPNIGPTPSPGITLAVTDSTLTEGLVDVAEFTVVLDAPPTTDNEDVTVRFSGLPGYLTTFPPTAIFDESRINPTYSWNRPYPIEVEATRSLDDANAVNEEFSITATASGGGYDGVSSSPLRLIVLDDDATLEVDDVSIDEGERDTVTVTVTLANPAGSGGTDVTVDIYEGDGSNQRIAAIGTGVDAANRTISIPQGMRAGTLVLQIWTGVFSGTADPTLTVTASFGTADQNVYPVAGVDITLVNNPNIGAPPSPGITLAVTDSTLTEGLVDVAEFTVVLDAAPTVANEDVTVTFSGLPGYAGTFPTSAIFDHSRTNPTYSWNRPYPIEVEATRSLDDDNAVNEEFSFTATASGGGYDGVSSSPLRLIVLDDDATLEVDDVSIAEGERDTVTVTVTLASPAGSGGTDVTVAIAAGAGANETITAIGDGVAAADRTISIPANTKTGTLTLEIQAGDMTGIADATLAVTASFGAAAENVYPVAGIAITLVNDTNLGNPGVTVAVTDSTLSEGIPADSAVFTVVLDAEPTGDEDVTITFGGLPSGVATEPSTVVFNGGATPVDPWNTPQSITVKAGQDDNAVNEEFSITLTASGGGYDGIAGSPVRLTTMDDDATLEVDDVSIAEGATDTVTVTVTLASPAGSGGTDVTVAIAAGAGANETITAIGDGVAAADRTISIPANTKTGTLTLEIQAGDMTGIADATLAVTASFGAAAENVYPVAGIAITLVNDPNSP